MTKELKSYTRKELLALPDRHWDSDTTYSSVLMLASGFLHDSGWGSITLIGINQGIPIEIITRHSDDIRFIVTEGCKIYGGIYPSPQYSIDCLPKISAFHVWSRTHTFTVGSALSSIDITVSPITK